MALRPSDCLRSLQAEAAARVCIDRAMAVRLPLRPAAQEAGRQCKMRVSAAVTRHSVAIGILRARAFLPLVFKGARGSAPGPATPANFQHATRKQAHVPAETSAGGLPMRGRVCVRALPGHIPQHTCRLRSRDQPRAVLALRKTPASGE